MLKIDVKKRTGEVKLRLSRIFHNCKCEGGPSNLVHPLFLSIKMKETKIIVVAF